MKYEELVTHANPEEKKRDLRMVERFKEQNVRGGVWVGLYYYRFWDKENKKWFDLQ